MDQITKRCGTILQGAEVCERDSGHEGMHRLANVYWGDVDWIEVKPGMFTHASGPSGYLCGAGGSGTVNAAHVTCPKCRRLMIGEPVTPWEPRRR